MTYETILDAIRDEMSEPPSNDISAAIAVRDLMSAIVALTELPPDLVKLEYADLELAEGQLSLLLEKIYDRDTVRRLRQRSRGHS